MFSLLKLACIIVLSYLFFGCLFISGLPWNVYIGSIQWLLIGWKQACSQLKKEAGLLTKLLKSGIRHQSYLVKIKYIHG